jgi:hypothetical protein
MGGGARDIVGVWGLLKGSEGRTEGRQTDRAEHATRQTSRQTGRRREARESGAQRIDVSA